MGSALFDCSSPSGWLRASRWTGSMRRSRVLRAQAIQSHFTEAYQRGSLPPPFSDFERAWEKYEDDGKQYS
jgi:hypothetical protein